MGATTRVHYGSSTQHYLRDEANGEPWATPLPFPVQVVDKVEVVDHISKTKLVTTYKYRHGYFDGREREFRGFGGWIGLIPSSLTTLSNLISTQAITCSRTIYGLTTFLPSRPEPGFTPVYTLTGIRYLPMVALSIIEN